MPPLDEYMEEISDIWDSHWMTNMGVKHQKLETNLKEYFGISNISLMVNGHMALELAMQGMGLTGEVITTPFTFASTTHAIVRNGLTPVFCDINPDDYTIDADRIEALITDRTSAIVPVHVYGNICDVDKINHIAKKYNLKVIYDAAHTFGETYKDKAVCSYGDASVLSFHATKVFNTIEGGAVCFKDPEFGQELYNLKNFGITGPETVEAVGANAKMNELQAAMGICNLRHIDEDIDKRKAVVERYTERLKGIDGITIWRTQKNVKHNYSYFPIVIDEAAFGSSRDDIFDKLAVNGIGSRKYFYPITSMFDCYRDSFKAEDTPVALKISGQVLSLPLYSDLSMENVDRICNLIAQ